MKNETWTKVYQCHDPDSAAEVFTSIFLGIADAHAPFKKIKHKSRQAKWVTPEFLSLVDEKHHLCNVYNKYPTTFNAARKREAVRRVKKMMRTLKREYIEEALRQSKGDSKKLWRTIRDLAVE